MLAYCDEGRVYIMAVVQRETLKCDQLLIYPRLHEDCFVYDKALMKS